MGDKTVISKKEGKKGSIIRVFGRSPPYPYAAARLVWEVHSTVHATFPFSHSVTTLGSSKHSDLEREKERERERERERESLVMYMLFLLFSLVQTHSPFVLLFPPIHHSLPLPIKISSSMDVRVWAKIGYLILFFFTNIG